MDIVIRAQSMCEEFLLDNGKNQKHMYVPTQVFRGGKNKYFNYVILYFVLLILDFKHFITNFKM